MNKLILLSLFALIALSCGKGETGSPDSKKDKFEITDIESSKNIIVLGQRLKFTPTISGASGNITYDWKVIRDGETIESLYGNHESLTFNFEEEGSHTIKLTITRGDSDKSTYEEKFEVVSGYFQYGIWGNSQETIEEAESDNGNEINQGLVGVPQIVEGNKGLDYMTYKKGDYYYTYYFKNGKLFAGGATISFQYTNGADMRGPFSLYASRTSDIGKFLGITMQEDRRWKISEGSQKEHYESSNVGLSQAVGYGYLTMHSAGSSPKGRGSVELYKNTASSVLLMFTLVGPE